MLIDMAFGSIMYVIVSLGFGENFEWSILFLSWFFALLPDLDFFLYVGIKKFFSRGRKLVTHHIIHFPLFFVGIVIVMWSITGDMYLCTLFLACTLGHLAHDAFTTPQGVQVFFPFSRRGYRFSGKGMHVVTLKERKEIMNERRRKYEQQALDVKGEFFVRLEKMNLGTWVAIVFACALVFSFAFFFPKN